MAGYSEATIIGCLRVAAASEVEVWTPLMLATASRDNEIAACVIGWEETLVDGTRAAVVEAIIVHPKHRGRGSTAPLLREVRDAWDSECRARGLDVMVTRIEKARPKLISMGIRYAGYKPYAEDEEFIWCFRTIPAGS
jgi:GNAT superfamily N-acetyltransferase